MNHIVTIPPAQDSQSPFDTSLIQEHLSQGRRIFRQDFLNLAHVHSDYTNEDHFVLAVQQAAETLSIDPNKLSIAGPVTHTKIIATMGPAQRHPDNPDLGEEAGSVNKEMIRDMMIAGARVFRLNFSHVKDADHAGEKEFAWVIREVAAELGISDEVKIMGDLQGPKHRLGLFKKHGNEENGSVEFKAGDTLIMHSGIEEGYKADDGTIHAHFKNEDVYPHLQKGEEIKLADGAVILEVLDTGQDEDEYFAKTQIIQGTELSDRKGVNFPDSNMEIDVLPDKDLHDLPAMIDIRVDKIAVSFIQTAEDVINLKQNIARIKAEKSINDEYTPLNVGKIEKPLALLNIDEIGQEVDEFMFARGDMGVEIDENDLPVAKEIIKASAHKHGKPVIIATQVMSSLQFKPNPTRSEICAVNTYVDERTDFLMFSEETAMGRYVIAAINAMQRGITKGEFLRDFPKKCTADFLDRLANKFNQTDRVQRRKNLLGMLKNNPNGRIAKANGHKAKTPNEETLTPASPN